MDASCVQLSYRTELCVGLQSPKNPRRRPPNTGPAVLWHPSRTVNPSGLDSSFEGLIKAPRRARTHAGRRERPDQDHQTTHSLGNWALVEAKAETFRSGPAPAQISGCPSRHCGTDLALFGLLELLCKAPLPPTQLVDFILLL